MSCQCCNPKIWKGVDVHNVVSKEPSIHQHTKFVIKSFANHPARQAMVLRSYFINNADVSPNKLVNRWCVEANIYCHYSFTDGYNSLLVGNRRFKFYRYRFYISKDPSPGLPDIIDNHRRRVWK